MTGFTTLEEQDEHSSVTVLKLDEFFYCIIKFKEYTCTPILNRA